MALSLDEILKRSQRLQGYWSSRNDRISEWMVLETLFDENTEPGFESAVTNAPATIMSLAVHLLSGRPMKHRVKVGGQDDSAIKRAGKLERGLEGWWNLADDQAFFSGHDAFSRELAYWMTLTGWYSVLLGIHTDASGKVMPLIDFHDPRDAYQIYGSRLDGMQTYVHIYETTLGEAQKLAALGGVSFNNTSGDELIPVTVYDYWEKVKDKVEHSGVFSVANQGREWAHFTETVDTDRIPVLSGPVGGSPWKRSPTATGTLGLVGVGTEEWMKRMGMSVLEANRPLWIQFNKYYSLLLEIAKNYAEPDKLRIRLEAGGERREHLRDGGNVYDSEDINSRIMRDEPGRAPIEVLQVLERLHQDSQKGSFPDALYGQINVDLSGFAISQLLEAALHKLGPYKEAMQRVTRQADRWFLDQFREMKTSLTLSGRESGSGIFLEEFHSSDVPREYALEVDVDLSMPSDLLARIATVRNAIPGNEPILDLMTALEDIIKVDDPRLVKDRINQDTLARLPAIQQLNAITAIRAQAKSLENDGQKDMAKLFLEYADFLTQQAAQATGGGQGGGAPGPRNELDPRALPPEASGISPSQARRLRNPGTPNVRRFGL